MGDGSCFSYDIVHEGEENILRFDCEKCSFLPSIEDNTMTMSKTIEVLTEVANITKIVYIQKRDYEYEAYQTSLLVEIASVYKQLLKQKSLFSFDNLAADPNCKNFAGRWHSEIQYLLLRLFKNDPLGAYVELKRTERRERIALDTLNDDRYAGCIKKYIQLLNYILNYFEKTKLITIAKPHLPGYKLGDRSVYRKIFQPSIKPDFMYTKLMSNFPSDGEEIDTYQLMEDTDITIFKFQDSVRYLYHMMPPEFKLEEEQYEILDLARKVMAEHKPKKSEFVDPERMREVFFNVGKDLVEELMEYRHYKGSNKEITMLADILVRYTVGFGLIEVLLSDEKVQDISVNSPYGETPIYIVHGDYDDCYTNIIPTRQEAESWASKLRMISGRPLDEANQILDTEIELPAASSRVSVITEPLDPTGLAFSFRRHRDKPWTLPLFMKNKMISPLAAGCLSFLIDGTRTMLIAGTRSLGKSSFLGSLLVEIMRRYRMLTIEDSVTGDSSLVYRYKNVTKHGTVEEVMEEISIDYKVNVKRGRKFIYPNNLEIFSFDGKKTSFKSVSKMIAHKTNKDIFEIKTKTGRKIKVTKDHSIFNLSENLDIVEVKPTNLNTGDFVCVPGKLNNYNKNLNNINLYDYLDKSKGFIFSKHKLFDLKKLNNIKKSYSKSTVQSWVKSQTLPITVFDKLNFSKTNLYYKVSKNSRGVSLKLNLTKEFLTFIGMWFADGCYDKNSVIISMFEKEELDVLKKVAKQFNCNLKKHSDGFSYMLNSKDLKNIMQNVLGLKGTSYTKKMPNFIFNLSTKQINYVLKGIFSGDGCISKNEILLSMCSRSLINEIQTLLLYSGIISRLSAIREKDKTYALRISALKFQKIYAKEVGILSKKKREKLFTLIRKKSTHDSTDVIPLNLNVKKEIHSIIKNNRVFSITDYITRNNNVGREKLKKILYYLPPKLSMKLKKILNSELYFDQITLIKKLKPEKRYVYDFSVPGTENFVVDNVLAHNTLELPTNSLRKLGYNVQPMKVASALAKGSSEMDASDGIRATLRLGDSALIVGEVRSKEAVALYEAMRVGAAANVVAGTIHSDSPYGVYDRVVNDIGVPKTSFKATDIIIVANPVKSASGMKKLRRVTQITEVRKNWENDPMTEGGFMDLFKYDAKKDLLEPTSDLINGDSEILKTIAGNIKEFAGNWDAVWDNINLRAKLKQTLVEYSEKLNNPDILEAEFVIRCNDRYHNLCEVVQSEVGYLDSDRIFFEWEEWLKMELKKKKDAGI